MPKRRPTRRRSPSGRSAASGSRRRWKGSPGRPQRQHSRLRRGEHRDGRDADEQQGDRAAGRKQHLGHPAEVASARRGPARRPAASPRRRRAPSPERASAPVRGARPSRHQPPACLFSLPSQPAWAPAATAPRRVGAARHAPLGVAHAVLAQVVADHLAHDLRGRQVLARAEALERFLLRRIDQQREPCSLRFHGPPSC